MENVPAERIKQPSAQAGAWGLMSASGLVATTPVQPARAGHTLDEPFPAPVVKYFQLARRIELARID
jgi:hypothetical protein